LLGPEKEPQLLSKQKKHPGERVSTLKREYLLQRFWKDAMGFWGPRGPRLSWVLSALILLVILLYLAATFGMNVWTRALFDALQKSDSESVLYLSMIYLPLLGVCVLVSVTNVFARMTIQRRWREWLNICLVNRWLNNGNYYQPHFAGNLAKNPECRIADDVRIATEAPVDFVAGIITSVLSAATFIVVLWTIGGDLTVHLNGSVITIPGFLVFAAVIYAIFASGFTVVIGHRFIQVSESKNQAEAEYRYALTRLRENAENIALLRGENEERNGVDASFKIVLSVWRDICVQFMRNAIVAQTSGYVASALPIILCAPKFLDGSMTLGAVMQAASAFTVVQGSFSWLVDNFPRFADWTASARRIASLQLSLDLLDHAKSDNGSRITRGEAKDAALRLRNVSVRLDDRTTLVLGAEITIKGGEKVLITGDSGSGKSTLVRTLAGLWPWGEGHIETRPGAKLSFVPQHAYVPAGTLRTAVNYPDPVGIRSEEEVTSVLNKVGLGHLVERLDEIGSWGQTLSGGEKQRLAFARIFLHRPGVIVLDEATAALDTQSGNHLMELLCRELKEATIVSIGHRSELEQFCSRKIVLKRSPEGAKIVSDVYFIPKPILPIKHSKMAVSVLWNPARLTRHSYAAQTSCLNPPGPVNSPPTEASLPVGGFSML
jgi:putative ATP-binding cassette transporter